MTIEHRITKLVYDANNPDERVTGPFAWGFDVAGSRKDVWPFLFTSVRLTEHQTAKN